MTSVVDFSALHVINYIMKQEFVRRLNLLRMGKILVRDGNGNSVHVRFRDIRAQFPGLNEKTLGAYWLGESLPSDVAWEAIKASLRTAGFDTTQFLTNSPIYQELCNYGSSLRPKKQKKEISNGQPTIFDFAAATATDGSECS